MADDIKALLALAPFSFIGTIVHLGAATMTTVPVDGRTAVVHVDHVLHAPAAFTRLEGQQITVQLAGDVDAPAVGEAQAFFAKGLAFGDSIAVTEVGRLPVEAVQPHAQAAVDAGKTAGAFEGLIEEMRVDDLRGHLGDADAAVIGRVIGVEKAAEPSRSEHDPHWWRATIAVDHVEAGGSADLVAGATVQVLFANSDDVRWHRSPKPRPGQNGLFLLHASPEGLFALAPFQLLHPEDMQPAQQLDAIKAGGA